MIGCPEIAVAALPTGLFLGLESLDSVSFASVDSAVRLDHPFLTGAYIGKPGPADPSYAFFSLLRRGEF